MSTPNRDQGSPILRRRENCITTTNPPDEGTGGSVQNESDKETVDDVIPFATNIDNHGSVIALDTPSLCQELYEYSGCCKKVLLVMCIGLYDKDNHANRKLADLLTEPYSLAKDKKAFKYTNDMLCNEVIRRATIRREDSETTKIPRPSAWSSEILHRYLMEFLQ